MLQIRNRNFFHEQTQSSDCIYYQSLSSILDKMIFFWVVWKAETNYSLISRFLIKKFPSRYIFELCVKS